MRYLPHTPLDRAAMLQTIGAATVDALFCDVPAGILQTQPLDDLPSAASEMTVQRHMTALAAANLDAEKAPFFIGCGAYRHHVPASVDHLIQRGEFLTSYTPYQPEIAQGTLHYLFEFQTQVARLLGMEVANASLYDGSTACAEAILMARRITRRSKALVSAGLHPHYIETCQSLTQFTGDRLVVGDPVLTPDAPGDDLATLIAAIDDDTSCVVVQNPNVFGHIADLTPLADAAHAKGALLVVVVTEVVALGALESPGAMGADIVVAEGQSLGVGLNFGGPHLGLFAAREKYVRQMPGRLVGETVDAQGRRGFVLTLSAREQHIRREKATSNICTNSGLCALAFTIHMSLLGGEGLRQLAALNHAKAVAAAEALAQIPGVTVVNGAFFNEFTVQLPVAALPVVQELAQRGILAGVALARLYPQQTALDKALVLAVTETNSPEDVERLVAALREILSC